jgi:hypothetical protein
MDESPAQDIKPKDETPPNITAEVLPEPNADGWHNADVVVHFSAFDNESGLQSVTPDITLSSEGADQSATGTAVDKAGNSAIVIVSGINIDKTAPTADIVLPFDGEQYARSEIMGILYSTDDNLSGVKRLEVLIDEAPVSMPSIDLFEYGLGAHVLSLTAEDKAGNKSESTANFTIAATVESAIADIERLSLAGEIFDPRARDWLVGKLGWIEDFEDKHGEKIERRSVVFERIMNRCADLKGVDWCEERLNPKKIQLETKLSLICEKIVQVKLLIIKSQLELNLKKNWVSERAYGIISEDIEYLRENL